MVKLKLALRSGRPNTIYSLSGKPYRLRPGMNILELEYDEYVSLVKALGIKPVEKDEKKDEHKPEDKPVDEKHEESHVEEPTPAEDTHVEEPVHEDNEDVSDDSDPAVDYSTWSYADLKAEYKSVTGKSCKLKKDEIIAFLQEHSNNAE